MQLWIQLDTCTGTDTAWIQSDRIQRDTVDLLQNGKSTGRIQRDSKDTIYDEILQLQAG